MQAQLDFLRLVEVIHQEKEIEKETIFLGIEAALQATLRKNNKNDFLNIDIHIDRETGKIMAFTKDGEEVEPPEFGRIAAQVAKQIIMQKIREAERDVIFSEFEKKRRQIVTGYIHRYEEDNSIIVNLGKAEGIIPLEEQVPDEIYHPGDTIKAYLLEVKKNHGAIKIILSRSHPELIRRLFELEVPEIERGIIKINSLVRECGYRTKIAVSSIDKKIDCIGACVGLRGARIRNIIEELKGEKIDIIRWDDTTDLLIINALKPADISAIELDNEKKRATVIVSKSQQPLAIGREGQNVRLASKLCRWEIDIVSEEDILSEEDIE